MRGPRRQSPPRRWARRPNRERSLARRHLHEQVALDLVSDLIQQLQRDFLARESRAGNLDQLAPEGIAGRQQEEHQKQHDADLPRHGQRAHSADRYILTNVERGLLYLHARRLLATAWYSVIELWVTYAPTIAVSGRQPTINAQGTPRDSEDLKIP